MNRHLVVSYDPDQQQFFYDVVFAETSEAAKEKLLSVRTYCTDADAIGQIELAALSEYFSETDQRQSESDLEDFRTEIEPPGQLVKQGGRG